MSNTKKQDDEPSEAEWELAEKLTKDYLWAVDFCRNNGTVFGSQNREEKRDTVIRLEYPIYFFDGADTPFAAMITLRVVLIWNQATKIDIFNPDHKLSCAGFQDWVKAIDRISGKAQTDDDIERLFLQSELNRQASKIYGVGGQLAGTVTGVKSHLLT